MGKLQTDVSCACSNASRGRDDVRFDSFTVYGCAASLLTGWAIMWPKHIDMGPCTRMMCLASMVCCTYLGVQI